MMEMKSRQGLLGAVAKLLKHGRKGKRVGVLLLDQPVRGHIIHNSISCHRARYQIGQVVRHRTFPFRGVIFDVDPQFANSEEWYQSIPEEVRPRKDQPYYHLFAENERTHYVAYVSEQNLLPDDSPVPLTHPDIQDLFEPTSDGSYVLRKSVTN
jgi:heat shock protein HspQ